MIYQGTSANTTGIGTRIGRGAFNGVSGQSIFLGLVYGTASEQHGYGNNSTIMVELNDWYKTNIQDKGYGDKVDSGAGFCSDRGPNSGWSNTGNFNYASYTRITSSKPSLNCGDADILSVDNKRLTYPIGLITADEVMYGGIPYNDSTTSNYLYTGLDYWTMSPSNFYSTGIANIFIVYSSGRLIYRDYVRSVYDVRPVINLKADTLFNGNGTSTDPYVV